MIGTLVHMPVSLNNVGFTVEILMPLKFGLGGYAKTSY